MTKTLVDNECWHFCPVCKQDHFHLLEKEEVKKDIDEYDRLCEDCREEGKTWEPKPLRRIEQDDDEF